jgi:F-type H+-transporting ATPase subunit b
MSGWTLAFQVINFLVLAALLRRFLFKPVMAMIAKRQADLARVVADGERARREGEDLRRDAEKALADMDATLVHSRAEAAALAERDRQAVLAKARQEADAIREAARREVEIERDKAAEVLVGEAVDLGTALARRLLAEVSGASIAEAFLTRLCEHLESLPPERVRALVEDLDGGELVLATAPPLSPGDADRWIARVTARLGKGARARLASDDSLVAGAELRLPHTTLSYCWRDGLRATREELARHAEHR